MDQVNDWLCSWGHSQGLGFCDPRCTFERLGMLALDGAHLTRWGRSVLGSKLAGTSPNVINQAGRQETNTAKQGPAGQNEV